MHATPQPHRRMVLQNSHCRAPYYFWASARSAMHFRQYLLPYDFAQEDFEDLFVVNVAPSCGYLVQVLPNHLPHIYTNDMHQVVPLLRLPPKSTNVILSRGCPSLHQRRSALFQRCTFAISSTGTLALTPYLRHVTHRQYHKETYRFVQ